MDKLKEILAKSKPNQKVVRNSSVMESQRQKFKKEQQEIEKMKKENEMKRLRQIDQFYSYGEKKVKKNEEIEVPMSVEEVIGKLRQAYQPATLFGETAYGRYKRYLKVKKFQEEHPNEDMRRYDQDFIRKLKQNEEYDELDARLRPQLIQPKLLDDSVFRKKKEELILKQTQVGLADMCDQIFLWLKKLLRAWGECLQQKYHENSNQIIKRKFSILNQSNEQLKTLFQILKKRAGDLWMIKSIYYIMNCCLIREYIQANDRYIDLSIGNAPWPMGQAMLGITIRRNIQKLTYVLDSQMTRKWMQILKRLITVSQELYPNEDTSKMVAYTVHSMI